MREVLRMAVPADDPWLSLRLSPDGEHALVTWREGTQLRGSLDGEPLPPAFWPRGASPLVRFSEDLKDYVVVSRVERDCFVEDRRTRQGPFRSVELALRGAVSPRGACFKATRDGELIVTVAEQEFGPFENATPPFFLDAHGARYFFSFRKGRTTYARIDQAEYGPYQSIDHPSWSEDGRVVAYACRRGARHVVMVEGTERAALRSKRDQYVMDPTGTRIATMINSGKSSVVHVDGELVCTLEKAVLRRTYFSPDSRRFAMPGWREGRAWFFAGGELSGPYSYADGPWWSADGSHLAWVYEDGESSRNYLVVDGSRLELPGRPDWETGGGWGFAPDGRFICVLRGEPDGGRLMIGGEVHGPFFWRHRGAKPLVQFTQNNRHAFAYSTLDQKLSYVEASGGLIYGPFRQCDFAFTRDGHLSIIYLDKAASAAVQCIE